MNTEERRNKILDILLSSTRAISATKLAEKFSVSRQIIVGDIAILRAGGKDIISTQRGYILNTNKTFEYVGTICANHSLDEIKDELITIVDFGGTCIDISISHDIYGEIVKPLNISSRYEVNELLEKIKINKPLSSLSNGIHFHKIGTNSKKIFDMIIEELEKKGLLK